MLYSSRSVNKMAHSGILRLGIATRKNTLIRSSCLWLCQYKSVNDFCSYVSNRNDSVFKNMNYRFYQASSVGNLDRYVSGKILENYFTIFVKPVTTTLVLKKKKRTKEKNQPHETEDDSIDDSFLEDPAFEALRCGSKVLEISDSKSGVMVLQPWVKWGACKKTNTTGQLMLDEAVALVSTLPSVHVMEKVIMRCWLFCYMQLWLLFDKQ